MKNNKLLFLLVGLFLLVSTTQLVFACRSNEYNDLDNDYSLRNGDDVIFILRNVDYSDKYDSKYWENEDRFPVYDYREGYSYRATRAYQESLNERTYRNAYYDSSYISDRDYNRHNSRPYDYGNGKEYYYTYDDYMRTYTKHECYPNPPKDKLFYIKCP
jgi:hypothetical protein